MLFVIRFTDKPDSLAIRQHYLEAHLSWLDERRQSVLVAGSLRTEPETDPIGALWVVQAENKNTAEELFKTDPFWTNGLRKSFEIFHWSKAFSNEKVPI